MIEGSDARLLVVESDGETRLFLLILPIGGRMMGGD